MLDWNWLYSAIAQSAAAIVAFFGGFIATRIITNQSEHSRLFREIQQCIMSCHKLTERINVAKFPYAIKSANRDAVYQTKRLIDQTNGEKTAEYYYAKTEYSDYESHEVVLREINNLINQKRAQPEQRLLIGEPGWLGGEIGVMHKIQHETSLQAAHDEIRDLIAEANHQARVVSSLVAEAKANPFSSRLLQFSALSVLVLFFIGVIYPLSFLPSDGEIVISMNAFWVTLLSLKGLLLAAISGIFSTVLLVLLVANFRLKIPEAMILHLENYEDPHNYSSYCQKWCSAA